MRRKEESEGQRDEEETRLNSHLFPGTAPPGACASVLFYPHAGCNLQPHGRECPAGRWDGCAKSPGHGQKALLLLGAGIYTRADSLVGNHLEDQQGRGTLVVSLGSWWCSTQPLCFGVWLAGSCSTSNEISVLGDFGQVTSPEALVFSSVEWGQ